MRARLRLLLPLVLVVPALVPLGIDAAAWVNRRTDLAVAFCTVVFAWSFVVVSVRHGRARLPRASRPLWPEYLPFDHELRRVTIESGLVVFAHLGDLTLGQSLFGGEGALCRTRAEWLTRWDDPSNAELVPRVPQFGSRRGLTPREVNMAFVLSHFP